MKKLGIIFLSCFLLFPLNAAAKVYWVGRNIVISPDGAKDTKMLTALGHSYLILIPNNPKRAKAISPSYAKYEKSLGCNKRGVVIGAYLSQGSEQPGGKDGNLEAQINAAREEVPTRDFLCGTVAQKKKWNFVSGTVKSDLDDAQFIKKLLDRAEDYIAVTRTTPVDYHSVRSVLDGISASNNLAQNCNSFAFSLLAYSEASQAPDIGAKRDLPGNRHLLPQYLFFRTPIIQPAGYVPKVVKNDNAYRKRVQAARELRDAINNYQFPISPF
ncbi:MAG: hypothetical protein J5601_02315 [Elusimicrobiaceae bacterium]|nr:hypothetical protein [Elusimicrobiaceae bacterium]